YFTLFGSCSPHNRSLHSFPTRRSSDLGLAPTALTLKATLAPRLTEKSAGCVVMRGWAKALPATNVRSQEADRVMIRRLRFMGTRSEEHTSELQSRENLVCRLLLEKKKR